LKVAATPELHGNVTPSQFGGHSLEAKLAERRVVGGHRNEINFHLDRLPLFRSEMDRHRNFGNRRIGWVILPETKEIRTLNFLRNTCSLPAGKTSREVHHAGGSRQCPGASTPSLEPAIDKSCFKYGY